MAKIEKKKSNVPYSLETEKSFLSCLLIDKDLIYNLNIEIVSYDFYIERHKIIYEAMQDIIKNNIVLDLITLIDKLEKTYIDDKNKDKNSNEKQNNLEKVGGIEYISEIATYSPGTSNFLQYAKQIKRDSTLRKLAKAAESITKVAIESEDSEDALSFAEKAIFDISDNVHSSKLMPIGDTCFEVLGRFDKIRVDSNAFRGTSTGFMRLDSLMQGLHKSDLIVLAARPACGKTAFSMNIAANVALNGGVVAIFSLEMSAVQLIQRMICATANVEIVKPLTGSMNSQENFAILEASRKLAKSKLFVDASTQTKPLDIISRCRKLKAEQGSLDLVVIDYLGLMTTGKRIDNRVQEVGELSRSMKLAAKELDVPVILLSQLNRGLELRKVGENEPQLSDLRDSGAIEQDADIVMFLHNPVKFEKGQSNRLVNLIVAKHRNGATANIEYLFQNDRVRFEELSEMDGKAKLLEAREIEKQKEKNAKATDDDDSNLISNESIIVSATSSSMENDNVNRNRTKAHSAGSVIESMTSNNNNSNAISNENDIKLKDLENAYNNSNNDDSLKKSDDNDVDADDVPF